MTDAPVPDIRWKQRFSNLQKAFAGLRLALGIEAPDVVQRAGIIQFFEMSFELSWKTMKDYLEYSGFQDLNSPRSVIKTAFQAELIVDGQGWLECLEKRNQMAHIYDEEALIAVEREIRAVYVTLLSDLVAALEKQQ